MKGRRAPAALLLSVLLGAVGLACSGPRTASSTAEPTPPPARYSLRGMVRQLPAEGARRALLVQHEALPELVDMTGEVVGMDAMAMEFDVADEVDLAGLEPGDKVLFTLEVDWDAEPPALIRALEPLPDDTELVLR